jgi:predicted CXXCH cytochrome family protein
MARVKLRLFVILVCLAVPAGAAAGPPPRVPPPRAAAPAPAKAGTPKVLHRPRALAPLPANVKAAWSHSPFADGDCSICHQRKDPSNPGKVTKAGNDLCFECHDDLRATLATSKVKHASVVESCTSCHNPHNARYRYLLVDEPMAMCTGCHTKIKKDWDAAAVKHGALATGKTCMGCHTPHASSAEKLLLKASLEVCLSCHDKDGLKDDQGKALTNIKKLLDSNPVHHAPVANGDCTACHSPHSSPNFRLLTLPYPAQFYSPFDPKAYALCFDCHNDEMIRAKETTITGFRDGPRNLHFLHVNKAERGRTCRACHEVHASKQPFQIRDGVPYGNKAWILKLHYAKASDGGSCDKTCHSQKAYKNVSKKRVKSAAVKRSP